MAPGGLVKNLVSRTAYGLGGRRRPKWGSKGGQASDSVLPARPERSSPWDAHRLRDLDFPALHVSARGGELGHRG